MAYATDQSPDIGELAAALAKVQSGMRGATKDTKNPHLKTKYADLTSVVAAVQPELGNNVLAIMQTNEAGPDGALYLATTLAHTSGQWLRGRLRVDVQPSKGINMSQALGLALTYCRRYSIAAMCCVCTEDDDGHGAGPAATATPATAAPADPNPPAVVGKVLKALDGELVSGPGPDQGVPYFRFLQKCQELKGQMGDKPYYQVLGTFQLAKSNKVDASDIKTMKAVVEALITMEEHVAGRGDIE